MEVLGCYLKVNGLRIEGKIEVAFEISNYLQYFKTYRNAKVHLQIVMISKVTGNAIAIETFNQIVYKEGQYRFETVDISDREFDPGTELYEIFLVEAGEKGNIIIKKCSYSKRLMN